MINLVIFGYHLKSLACKHKWIILCILMPMKKCPKWKMFFKILPTMQGQLKRLACNRREASSSLLHPHCADTHTQHNKKVDEHQIAKWKKSYFINGASHKHFNYIFENKSNYFFHKSGVRFEIWTLLFFMTSSDLSNLGGQKENLKFYCGFWCGKKGRFWCNFKWKYKFWLSEALG